MGIYLARQLLGPIQGVQPQILWLIVRHYAISFTGPNYSFQYHVGISFRTESQCNYPCRLSLKKLKVFMVREQKRGTKKKIKESFFFFFNNIYLVTTLLMTILTFTWRKNKNNVQEIKENYNVTAFTTN